MTPLELCEPLFQCVCRVNRSVRKGVQLEPSQTRAELKAILGDLKAKAAGDRVLSMQFDKLRLPLIFFVDFMVRDCGALGRQWTDLANEEVPAQLGGDEKFFDLLEETLRDPSEAASERLAVFYTCLGLGFTGWYAGQPEHLRRKMTDVSARIRGSMDVDEGAKICPEAYEHLKDVNLVEAPGSRLTYIGIALVGLLLVVFAANAVLYSASKTELEGTLERIIGAFDASGPGTGTEGGAGS